MMQITLSTNSVTMMRSSTAALVCSTLATSFSTLMSLKAISSLVSFTNALITAMPEKLSWAKSLSREKAPWRISHFRFMLRPTTVEQPSSRIMGIMDRRANTGFIRNIFSTASTPSSSASKNIITPQPKHSCTVSRSLVNRLIIPPTLCT